MFTFFAPEISENQLQISPKVALSEAESLHLAKVLRMEVGQKIQLFNGKGVFAQAAVVTAHHKRSEVLLESLESFPKPAQEIHLAIVPTKQIERVEWLLEKATEIGLQSLILLRSFHSERKDCAVDRLEKIALAACKQSRQPFLPKIAPMERLETWLEKVGKAPNKFLASQQASAAQTLSAQMPCNAPIFLLIGPEGGFSSQEEQMACQAGFLPFTLGKQRLRAETAALAACMWANLLQIDYLAKKS